MTIEILLRVVIAALAAYRVARMIALEDGPFDIFNNFRVKFDKPKGVRKSWVGRGVECPLCVGFYASLVMLGLSYVDYVFYGVLWLAVAGLQVALQDQERQEIPKVMLVKILPEPEIKPKEWKSVKWTASDLYAPPEKIEDIEI